MSDALLAFVCIFMLNFMNIFGASNLVGGINEKLEILTPDMKKIKLSRKFVRFVPQWCKIGCRDPEGARYKSDIYILTVILAVINYMYGLLSFVVEIVVFIICFEYFMYLMLLPVVWMCVLWTFDRYYCFAIKKAGKAKVGFLDKDFTIKKEAENGKSDVSPESMTDNQDKSD